MSNSKRRCHKDGTSLQEAVKTKTEEINGQTFSIPLKCLVCPQCHETWWHAQELFRWLKGKEEFSNTNKQGKA